MSANPRLRKLVFSLAVALPLLVAHKAAWAAAVMLDCPARSGTVSSSLATANTNGAIATDNMTVTNAPVGTTVTISYSSTSNNNKRAQSSLASGTATGPSPAGPITINGSAGSGSQL